MSIGKRIQDKRKENGLSVNDLAKAVGVNRATIYRWENEESTPPKSAVSAIAHILHTDLSWLLDDSSSGGVNLKENSPSLLTPEEIILLSDYRDLNNTGKETARNLVKGLKATFPKEDISESVS